MTSILKRLTSSLRRCESRLEDQLDSSEDETQQKLTPSEKPYILCSIFYLVIILLIGLPIWCYTCSQTRYSLPDPTQLNDKLSGSYPRLHLDISVVQLSSIKSNHDRIKEDQSDYLRSNLPEILNTSIDGLSYNINWRIRRSTQEESSLVKNIFRESSNSSALDTTKQSLLIKLEDGLLKVHKPINRFRIFMYFFEEPIKSLICDQTNSYIIDSERFVYLCPDNSDQHLVDLIQKALDEVYYGTVDLQRARKILGARTDLLVSLVAEADQRDLTFLSEVADKVHGIYAKNVKSKFLELTEVLNIKLITQNIFDLLANNGLDSMTSLTKPTEKALTGRHNSTGDLEASQFRTLDVRSMSRFYHNYEMRLNKHSSQSVNHVIAILPDPSRPPLAFKDQHSHELPSPIVKILEERDSNFILIGDNDKSLVLGLRAIVRRVIGLTSPNLCKNCLVRRDVFLNKWELDSIVGVLTALKLESVFISLNSISQQTTGIRIPRHVSNMAHESYESALKSLDNLAIKSPLEAYRLASLAYELSESAYYDPSLLETSYYPRETRWAIYTPLTLPLVLPFLMSIIRIVKFLIYGTSDGPPRRRKPHTD